MNSFLINNAIAFNQLNPKDKDLIYDFDLQFIPTDKYNAQHSYKNKKGCFPEIATISNVPVYIGKLQCKNGSASNSQTSNKNTSK